MFKGEIIIFCIIIKNPRKFENFRIVSRYLEFIQGVPEIEMFYKHIRNFLILDDLMSECGKNEAIKGVFCVDSHHKNISVFLLVQNAFTPEKYFRTMSVNAKYMIILNNPRDRLQFYKLALQVEPENYQYMKECYYDAVVIKQYGYLFLDFCQTTHRLLKVQTNFCFKNPKCIIRDIYIPK